MTAMEQPLLAQIDDAEERLGGLENELRAVDGELSTLAIRREQHRLLEQTCASLEALARTAPNSGSRRTIEPSALARNDLRYGCSGVKRRDKA